MDWSIVGVLFQIVLALVIAPLHKELKNLRDREEKFVLKESYEKDHKAQAEVNRDLFVRMSKREISCAKNHGAGADKC